MFYYIFLKIVQIKNRLRHIKKWSFTMFFLDFSNRIQNYLSTNAGLLRERENNGKD